MFIPDLGPVERVWGARDSNLGKGFRFEVERAGLERLILPREARLRLIPLSLILRPIHRTTLGRMTFHVS
jgi:hypothetical protein